MKALIITYYWPPAGGPGVQRWLKFVKYFRDFGIEPILYIPENPTYALQDMSLEGDIPDDITILTQRIFEPYGLAQVFSKNQSKTISKGIIAKKEKQTLVQRLLLYIRGNFFIPDARKYWVRPSAKYLHNYLLKNEVDIIITTGPPHSVHLIGMELKKGTSIPWLADFRDPWTTIGYHSKLKLTKKSRKKHKKLEKQVLTTSDHITVTSFTTKKEFQEITNQPISVITNGYDIEAVAEEELDKKFTISHIGSLLSGRNPKNLWQVLYEMCQEDTKFSSLFVLRLVGAVSDDVLQTIKETGLSNNLEVKGYVSHKEAVQIQRSSQVLLLIEIDSEETKCIIPGKLFEYMVAKRPILALGPKDADISKLLIETNAGSFFEYTEKEKLKSKIRKDFELFLKGNLRSEVKGIENYSRKELTKKMSKIIKEIEV